MRKKLYKNLPFVLRESVDDLRTVRDFIRYAVTRFESADLSYGHGTGNAFDEAVFMVLETLKLPIDTLEPWLDAVLASSERKALDQLIYDRITTRKPASYLLNRAYIQGRPFYVDERVIVPRSFIGEIMLDETAPLHNHRPMDSILELCTGSGCLSILAAEIFPGSVIDAVDLSRDALNVAKINVKKYDLQERITLHHGDLFEPVTNRKYDLIIANPPYVDRDGMDVLSDEYRHEPVMSLSGGEDGMDLVRKIIRGARKYMNPGAVLVCEIGRGRPVIESQFPDIKFTWLETELSDGEVFSVRYEDLTDTP